MIKYNGKVITYNDKWIKEPGTGPIPDPYNPLNLPPYTIRLRYRYIYAGWRPTFSKGTGVQVSSSPNVWDLTYENSDWSNLINHDQDLLEVLGANSTGVTNMDGMFQWCQYLSSVSIFDTSNVTNMGGMFYECERLTSVPLFDTSKVTNMGSTFAYCKLTSVPLFNTSNVTSMPLTFYACESLTTVPLFDTSKVTDMDRAFAYCKLTSVPLFNTSNVNTMNRMFFSCTRLTSVPLFNTSKVTNMTSAFEDCYNVESGALALYQQASSQTNPPTYHTNTFTNCGRDTTTGAAELAQIPSSWK